MKHIFLLEDDETLGRGITMALTGPETSVVCRTSLSSAREALEEDRFDLLILDVNLPDGSGLDLLRQVRAEGDATPVILLTANDLELDEVTGLEAGADDYITKPFSLKLVLMRIEAVLRRCREAKASKDVLCHRNIRLDATGHAVWLDGDPVSLTPIEYNLLELFLRNPGRVFTRDNLLNQVWGYEYAGDEKAVNIHIMNLRRKLGNALIDTIRGVGYRLAKD